MPVFDLYSKRRKRAAGDAPDVYTYSVPQALKVQIIHIWGDALGNPLRSGEHEIMRVYQNIVDALRREYGVFQLHAHTLNPHDQAYAFGELCSFFMENNNTDIDLDVIELTFRSVDVFARQPEYLGRFDGGKTADRAIEELNARFKEHGVGYSFSDGRLIRVDSELVHTEVVKPALIVLRQRGFSSAQSEFLAAHEHYRHGKNTEALIECYKAFESAMKIICKKRNWSVDTSKGAADLVKVCLDRGLIPPYWQSHFSGLRNILESAIPTPRNKQAGHGAGTQPIEPVPDELASYVLHMTAATILFLTEAERKLP